MPSGNAKSQNNCQRRSASNCKNVVGRYIIQIARFEVKITFGAAQQEQRGGKILLDLR
ncbi:MAG: hypothetical protein LBK60_00610 [Verrucomicrobiales bacterium]|nr:hypothetical protein [Verrucomicrobiales bacterium]